MKTLIGNQVKTEFSNYSFKDREQAEAFYFAARERQLRKESGTGASASGGYKLGRQNKSA